jgi:hypothetical protein
VRACVRACARCHRSMRACWVAAPTMLPSSLASHSLTPCCAATYLFTRGAATYFLTRGAATYFLTRGAATYFLTRGAATCFLTHGAAAGAGSEDVASFFPPRDGNAGEPPATPPSVHCRMGTSHYCHNVATCHLPVSWWPRCVLNATSLCTCGLHCGGAVVSNFVVFHRAHVNWFGLCAACRRRGGSGR